MELFAEDWQIDRQVCSLIDQHRNNLPTERKNLFKMGEPIIYISIYHTLTKTQLGDSRPPSSVCTPWPPGWSTDSEAVLCVRFRHLMVSGSGSRNRADECWGGSARASRPSIDATCIMPGCFMY